MLLPALACLVSLSSPVGGQRSILAFSKTAGFRHDSIPAATKALEAICKERGFTVTATEDASMFDARKLRQFDAVVFLMTTGDVLNPSQEKALTDFIRSGGGYVGVHAAADTEYDWPWYGKLVGAYFLSHPQIQDAIVRIENRSHPSTNFLPGQWKRRDEWYDYKASPRPNVTVLASLDPASYAGHKMGDDHPIVWAHEFDGGRSWYTGMGHTAESYQDPLFLRTIVEGIEWACGKSKRPQSRGTYPANATPLGWRGMNGWQHQTWAYGNGGQNPEHLVSSTEHGDAEVHVEFRIPKGSNSGVYLQGRYEVQILDSSGKAVKDLTFADCGGIYQRWQNERGFEGKAPQVNAFAGPGEWNTYDIRFRGPRFRGGRKVANAVFEEVRLNGKVVQRNVPVTGPTRAPFFNDESATGPLVLQADHGPVEFRNVWIRPLR